MRHARSDYDRIQDPENRIPEDEPAFLIRGKDFAGPGAVEAWANLAEALGADQIIIDAARRQAVLMREYQARVGSKVPDMPFSAGKNA